MAADPTRRRVRRIGMRRRLTIVSVLLVIAAGGCGWNGGDAPASDRSPESSAATPTGVTVRSVTVHQSGGIAGVDRTWRVTGDTPGSQRVFAAASNEAVVDSDGTTAPEVCCDFFVYSISIRYSDGRTVQLSATDGAPAEPAVQALLDAVLATDPAHPDGGLAGVWR